MAEGAGSAEAAVAPPPRRWFAGKLAFWLPWPLLVVADLWSKAAVFAWMGERYHAQGQHPVFETGILKFHLVTWENPGTIWGLFQGSTVPLMVLRCGAVIGLLVFVRNTAATARGLLVVLSLIFAGAIGNLYDNFTRARAPAPRSVRDFLLFSGEWPVSWSFPAFNVADSCITVGVIGLLFLLLREDRVSAKAARQVSS